MSDVSLEYHGGRTFAVCYRGIKFYMEPGKEAAEAVDAARIESGQCANNHHNGDGRDVSRVHSLHVRRVFRVMVLARVERPASKADCSVMPAMTA